jgi:hypothetical protein
VVIRWQDLVWLWPLEDHAALLDALAEGMADPAGTALSVS